jgi:NADH:ubiquinone oxidoreductase subunit 3 (subunit A)
MQLIKKGFDKVSESAKSQWKKILLLQHYTTQMLFPNSDPKTCLLFNHNDYDSGHYGSVLEDLFCAFLSVHIFHIVSMMCSACFICKKRVVIHIHTSQIDDQKYNCGVDIFF